jgi:hypothetical protein
MLFTSASESTRAQARRSARQQLEDFLADERCHGEDGRLDGKAGGHDEGVERRHYRRGRELQMVCRALLFLSRPSPGAALYFRPCAYGLMYCAELGVGPSCSSWFFASVDFVSGERGAVAPSMCSVLASCALIGAASLVRTYPYTTRMAWSSSLQPLGPLRCYFFSSAPFGLYPRAPGRGTGDFTCCCLGRRHVYPVLQESL